MQQEQRYQLAQQLELVSYAIEKYKDKILVVKYGGNAMENPALKLLVMSDLLLLNQLGIKIVLVHGGGIDIAQALQALGKESHFINGLRVTDDETIDIVQQVLIGKVNKGLVLLLKGKAIGLSGIDGQLFLCEKLQTEFELGWVGKIKQVNVAPIHHILEMGYIPVIATLGCDEQGNSYNINADIAASEIAINLNAERLICMTDIVGVLRDHEDKSSLIHSLSLIQVKELVATGVIFGGMLPKITGCIEAVTHGVNTASIIDGRQPHALLHECLSEQSSGTVFHR